MGLDYSIELYFPRGEVGRALRCYAQHAPPGESTIVRLLGDEVTVPVIWDWQKDPVELLAAGSEADFKTAAFFPIDEPIRVYTGAGQLGSPEGERAQVGCIYLSIRMGCLYSTFTFTAATSGMSRLFVESASIRSLFSNLLTSANGVSGWLDQEDFEFHSLEDPKQTILAHVFSYGEPSDRLAAALCEGLGRPLPVVQSVQACRNADTVALAKAIDATRAFELLPILADALQDAGCDNDDILNHCRGNVPHVRGCWVVDLVLGKS